MDDTALVAELTCSLEDLPLRRPVGLDPKYAIFDCVDRKRCSTTVDDCHIRPVCIELQQFHRRDWLSRAIQAGCQPRHFMVHLPVYWSVCAWVYRVNIHNYLWDADCPSYSEGLCRAPSPNGDLAF